MKKTGQSMAYGPLLKLIISYTGSKRSLNRDFLSFEKRGHKYATVNTKSTKHVIMKKMESTLVKARLHVSHDRLPRYSMIKLIAAPIKKSRKPSCTKTIVWL